MHLHNMTDFALFAEELLLSMIGVLLILKLYDRIYGNAVISLTRLRALAAGSAVAVTFLLKLMLPPGRPAATPPVTVFCSLLFLRYYPIRYGKKLLFSFILFLISFLWMIIADLLVTPLESVHYLTLTAFLHLVFYLLLYLIVRLGTYKEIYIPFRLWLVLMGIASFTAVVMVFILYFMLRRENPYAVTVEIPVLLLLLVINISLFVLFDRFSILIRDAKEKAALERQMQMQEMHYRELYAAHEQIRTICHDMKNYLRTAAELASKQENHSELLAFLSRTTGQLQEAEQVISTGNTSLDSVLNVKIAELAREHVRLDTKIHIPPDMNLSFEQAAGIFGNLLDNALEAERFLPEDERWLTLRMNYSNHALLIRIENASRNYIVWNQGLPVSSKNNPLSHGLGLKSVKKLVEQTGTFRIETTPSSFVVRLVLYDL